MPKIKVTKRPVNDNLVHKNAIKFNVCAVHADRKKAFKRGERKHKGGYDTACTPSACR